MRNHILFLILFALTGCCAAATEPRAGEPACWTATPEAGADVSLCPEYTPIITECDAPAPNPLPLQTDCTEQAAHGGKVWCCVPLPTNDALVESK
jgi:hypothetical protein